MIQRSVSPKRIAERRDPFTVDIPVGLGLGQTVGRMLDRCREHSKGEWAQHHHSTSRRPGVVPTDDAGFFFET